MMEDWSVVHKVSLLGFLGALVFGVVANKTHFCIMGSISDWVNMGSRVRFRAWMLSIGIAILGSQAMVQLGWVDLDGTMYRSANFGLAGFLIGGLLFGIGMTLGAGCGQRTLVRVGGGNLKSLVVLIVMAITAYATLRGLLAPVRIDVFGPLSIDLEAQEITSQGIETILAHLVGASGQTMAVIVALVLGLGAIIYALKDKDFRASADNILAGVTIGVLVVGAWYVTGVIGNDDFEPVPVEALTFIAPTGNTVNYLMTWTGAEINFGIAVVLGMIVGSFLYAISSGNFRVEAFTNQADMRNHLIAGVLMGFGGVLSFGCTIGQGVSGMSTLALGSLVALLSIMLGSALTMKVQYYMLDDGFWSALHQSLADLRLLPPGK
ncbi:MAG: YeeE/YedE family protein [Candidatus Thioglobus sp.]|nr:MAG: YeeE/YedE family protein [Candidatus Thioglobus sp.]